MVAVFVAGTAAVLAVPRPVAPQDVPAPEVRPAALAAITQVDARRARQVARQADEGRLDYDVRSLGDSVRAFGRAESDEDGAAMEQAHRRAVDAAHRAIARDPETVLGLRAYQTAAFLRAIRAFERTADASTELAELGGVFATSAAAYGWYDVRARQLLADDAALAVMYKKRWNDVTGLKGPAFAASLDEERALHRFLIAHPAVALAPLAPGASPDAERARAVLAQVATEEKRLQKIRDFAKIDPTFPSALAEGVVLFRLGRFEQAAVAFEGHLAANPDGPWTLRARNYLNAALEAR